jgi:phosphonate transport system ATP-binding protein
MVAAASGATLTAAASGATLPGAPLTEATLIAAEGVALRYPTGRLALDGASLAVAPGELVVILGANGCGKSTLLRCIAGMLRPTAGRVLVAGREIGTLAGDALRDARLDLGMVFQAAHLVRRRSVLANVMAGTLGRHRTLASALGVLPRCERDHAMTCLSSVGLEQFAPQRAGTLSGGQAQRASVARALAQRPRALLADEPVASLDPEAAEELMRLLRRLAHADGLAVLCVLHQPDLARRYADRLVGLHGGRVRFDAQPGRVGEGEVAALYEAVPAHVPVEAAAA